MIVVKCEPFKAVKVMGPIYFIVKAVQVDGLTNILSNFSAWIFLKKVRVWCSLDDSNSSLASFIFCNLFRMVL
ncbi:unnamed protein product [Rhizophagus irregularis]|nr:unnamed protein product [Rhizophagus irregularis]